MKPRQIPSWWPNRGYSEWIRTLPFRWHAQRVGTTGPKILLLHGTGASTHSWAPLISVLQNKAQLCAIDLPGHGFSDTPPIGQSTLANCTRGVAMLLRNLDFAPDVIVGHSAGAAIAVSLASDFNLRPKVICVNAAFGQFSGLAGVMFPYFAKIAAAAPFSARLLALAAQDMSRVKRLLDGTGSCVSDESLRAYATLFQSKDHVQGTLQFMAEWDLGTFLDGLGQTKSEITFLTGQRDKTVPPHISHHWANVIADAAIFEIPALGHLMQEEAPKTIADHIMAVALGAS